MKKIFKKATILLAAGITAFTMNFSVLSETTADASCKQRDWTTNGFGVDDDGYFRDQAIKDNDSSVYVKNSSNYANHGVYVTLWGNNSTNWYFGSTAYAETCTQYWETLDCFRIWVPGSTSRLIRQYIYENDCKYASILFDKCPIANSYGKWSPDSTSQQNSKFPTAN